MTRARSVLTSCEVYETLHWLTKIEVRAFHDRNKNDEKSIRTPFELAHAFEDGFRARLTSPGLPTWRPRRPTWRPRRPTWRPRRPNLPSGGRPKRVSARPWRDPERPGAPGDGRNQFFVHFPSFWVDFSSIFLTPRSKFGRFWLRFFFRICRAIFTR